MGCLFEGKGGCGIDCDNFEWVSVVDVCLVRNSGDRHRCSTCVRVRTYSRVIIVDAKYGAWKNKSVRLAVEAAIV